MLLSTLFRHLWEKRFPAVAQSAPQPIALQSLTGARVLCLLGGARARRRRRRRREGAEGGGGGGGGSGGAARAAPAPPGRCQPGSAAQLVPPRRPGTALSAGKATRRCPRWWREGCACVGSSGTGARGRCVLAAGREGGQGRRAGRAGGRRPLPGRAPPAPRVAAARLRAVPPASGGLMCFSAAPGPQ